MIGILGGTFDPIHYGHLRPALEVLQALGLEQLRLIPLRHPPHRELPQCPPQLRLAMVEAAVEGEPGLMVDERELSRDAISYSVDTLESLRLELGDSVPLCLLLGSDAFSGFPQWHQPERILELAHLVVMQRPGEHPARHYPQRVVSSAAELVQRPGGSILFQPVTQLEISSTAIREMLQKRISPRYLLPDRVLELIEQHGLYR